MLYEPLLKNNLAKLLKAFAAGTGLSPSTIGRRYADDSRFFDRVLEQDCAFMVRQYDRVVCRLSEAWPEETEWPEAIERPSARQVQTVLSKLTRARAA